MPNRGRDIGPKIVGFADVYPSLDYVLFLHSKKSTHRKGLQDWREFLVYNLAGTTAIVDSIVDLFEKSPSIGIICPQHFESIRIHCTWGNNLTDCVALAQRINLNLRANSVLDFPSGSMFWARPAALKPLLDCNLTWEEFPTKQDS